MPELSLVLTRACTLACQYCYAGQATPGVLPEAWGRRAIDWAVRRHRGRQGPLWVGYFGGEPLLAWDLLTQLHDYATAAGQREGVEVRGTVTTNGTVLDAARMDWLVAHQVVVGLSIDGSAEGHDRLRRFRDGRASHAAVARGLAVALARAPLTQTISVVDPANVGCLSDGVSYLLEQGVRVLSLSLNPAADWQEADLACYQHQMERIAGTWRESLRRGDDLWISPLDDKVASRVKGGLGRCDRCRAGTAELALSAAGRWYPCERMVGEDGEAEQAYSLGHVARTPDGGPDPARVLTLLRQRQAKPADCRTCALADRCINTCVCSNHMATGSVADPGGAICRTEQIAVQVADQAAAELYAEANPWFLRKYYAPRHHLV